MSEEDQTMIWEIIFLKNGLSGIIFINRNGLRWRDATAEYGPPKTLYNRWVRCWLTGATARIVSATS